MNKSIKIILISLMIFSIAALFCSKITITYLMNKKITALMVSSSNTDITPINIDIEGTYTKYIIGNDLYKGKFVIDGFDITEHQANLIDIKLGTKNYNDLLYRRWIGSKLSTVGFGIIFTSDNFNSFVILPYAVDPPYDDDFGSLDMSGEETNAICYPAKSREDAINLANYYVGKAFNDFRIITAGTKK